MPAEAEPTNPTADTHQENGTVPQDHSSDGEGGERTAREKLRTTTIQQVTEANHAASNVESHVEPGTRGRPSKKRSFEDLQTEDLTAGVENGGPPLPKKGLHKRMRSREVSGNDEVHGLETREDVTSPVQEESDAEAQKSPGGPGVLVSALSEGKTEVVDAESTKKGTAPGDGVAPTTTDEPASKTDHANDTSATNAQSAKPEIASSSGFANTSSTSPFSSFKPPKSPSKEPKPAPAAEKSTSTSAFASSGLSAFASSEKSPFAGSSSKPSGGFGGGGGLGGFGSATSAFGGPSPFASKPSSGFGSGGGFGSAGGLGGGFAASKPFAAGSTSFAGPAGAAGTFAKGKPFASTTEEHDEGSDDEADGDDARTSAVDAARDPRFKERESELSH